MENVTAILDRKQTHFNKISPTSFVSDALCRMSCQHADYLIVVDDDEKFLGLLTEHEIATQTIFTNLSINSTRVQTIMNSRWPVADADDSVEDCMRLMSRYNVRYLPVFKNLNFLGVISTEDILEEAVSHRFCIFDDVDNRKYTLYAY